MYYNNLSTDFLISNWWFINDLFRVSSTEIARSVERLLPELLTKSGDTTPRIHNMAVHTILSMADCKCVRELHIIPVHLTRPVNSSTHQRLALSRLEMVEQLILSHGISTEKQRWFWTIYPRRSSLHENYLMFWGILDLWRRSAVSLTFI